MAAAQLLLLQATNQSLSTSIAFSNYSSYPSPISLKISTGIPQLLFRQPPRLKLSIQCCSETNIIKRSASSSGSEQQSVMVMRTCKNCKTQFDPLLNHPRACRFHTCHFGGETRRKFESVHTGGTMDTPNSGKVLQYWHCCGSEDPFDVGCTASPHASYDD